MPFTTPFGRIINSMDGIGTWVLRLGWCVVALNVIVLVVYGLLGRLTFH